MKIMVAIPCMEYAHVNFAYSLRTLRTVGETHFVMKPNSLIYTARNELAAIAVFNNVDYVLWLDSDMVFAPNTLVKMVRDLEQNDLDIVTGLYFRRNPPFTPVLFDELKRDGDAISWSEFAEIPSGLFEVGGCGFGCVLMRAEVLQKVQETCGLLFAPIGNNGEDVAFCIRARECGYKIYCDPEVKCGHVAHTVINEAHFKMYGGTNETDRNVISDDRDIREPVRQQCAGRNLKRP